MNSGAIRNPQIMTGNSNTNFKPSLPLKPNPGYDPNNIGTNKGSTPTVIDNHERSVNQDHVGYDPNAGVQEKNKGKEPSFLMKVKDFIK